MIKTIFEDDRKIAAYFLSGDKTQGEQVGKNGVTKIEMYAEYGANSYKAYLEI